MVRRWYSMWRRCGVKEAPNVVSSDSWATVLREEGPDCENVGQHSHPSTRRSAVHGTEARNAFLNRTNEPWMRSLFGGRLLNRPFDFKKQLPKH